MSAPEPPGGEVHLEPPPEVPRVVPGSIMMKLLPGVMILASLGMMAFMFMRSHGNPMSMMFGGMFLMSTVGMMAGGRGGGGGGQKKAEMNEDRKDYLRYLGQMRDRARDAGDEQRRGREWSHPDPQVLWSIAASRRMWERRSGDQDCYQVRVCRGSQRLTSRLVPPQTGPVDELEPIATLALRRFVRAYSIVGDLPIAITIRGFAAIGIQGERDRARSFGRSLVGQLATFHSPEDLIVAIVTSGRAKEEWEWAKWLPHTQHPSRVDGIGPQRLMCSSLAHAEELLSEVIGDRTHFTRNSAPPKDMPQVLIVIDDGEVSREENILLEGGITGVTLMDLSDCLGALTARRGLRLSVEEERLGARSGGGVEWFGAPDQLSVVEAEALARKISPYRLGAQQESGGDESPLTSNPGMLELLGIPGDPMTFDVQQAWRPRPKRDMYRIPFGVGDEGQPIELDIKEAAEEGMGPHGLCVGATGSGKSEFLRTLVLGMLAMHSSTKLNMILVDFKGGATFLGFDKAPHVAAVITNLAGDLTLVDRMRDAIAGECARRQEMLANANAKNVWDYEKMRENGADLDPMPALFICIDEFSEMLTAKPDFIDLFLQIGRVGRSLQMHMLLASQRLEEGKLRGLDTYLSYRIGLKTFSASESRAALGVPDAYELPPVPGSGYLKFDTTSMVRFKAAYVSGPWRPEGMQQPVTRSSPVSADRRAKPFVPDYIELPPEPEQPVIEEKPPEPAPDESNEPSQLDLIIERMVGQGPPAHEVWLPPLEEPNSLDTLLPPIQPTEERGLSPVGFFGNGKLQVPLGLVDKPFEQRRDLLWADFSGAAGHGVIVGGPQSGKSMLFRTLVTSMALTHTSEEVQFYCLDFGGGTLTSLRNLPHVGGIAGRLDPDMARRMVAELTTLLNERELRFRDNHIDSMNDFRNRKRRGELPEDLHGDVFLIVDGWAAFRQEYESLESQVVNLAAQGLSFGVHVLVSATRWAEIRPAMKDQMGTRFELRLGDPSESEIDRKVAVNVPQGRPGRGLTRDKLHFLIGLPRIDGSSDDETVGDGIADASAKIRETWRGRAAPKVRLLPELLPYEDLLQQVKESGARPGKHLVPVGVNEEELAPFYLDFDAEPHFVYFADGENGKTNFLRTVVSGIVNNFTPKEAVVLLVDYRRTMLGYIGTDHLLGYAVSANQLTDMIKDVKGSMEGRLPGPDVTQEQLKNRSWWKGPELYVVVDDYDLVVTQMNNPLQPLSEFLAQAKDVGLHIIVTRRTGGAARSTYDPIIGKMKDISSPGMVGSGSKDEGQLWGNLKPSQQPPGRGTMISRKVGQQRVQLAWIPPE